MLNYRDLSDEELAGKLPGDDTRAFTELYGRFSGLLLRYAISVLKDEDEASDLVQDLFAHLWEKRASLHVHTTVKSFLYKSTLNRALDRIKHLKVAESYFSAFQDALDQGTLAADAPLLEKELAARIEAHLDKMPKKMREVFLFSRHGDLSYKEISEKLGISHATVASHIQNALRILRKGLNNFLFSFF